MKNCSHCKILKSYSEFKLDKRLKSGVGSWCKKCHYEYGKKRVLTNPDFFRSQARNRNAVRRKKIIDAYGGKCECCGETTLEFLEIDHINRDGGEHRRRIGHSNIYFELLREGFPKDKYRLLCCNCNRAMGARGYCPHQIKDESDKQKGQQLIIDRYKKLAERTRKKHESFVPAYDQGEIK